MVAARPKPMAVAGVTHLPRISPPQPAKSRLSDLERMAKGAGLEPLPWQRTAATYMTATGPDGWAFREVAVVVARQNGKTELLVPRVLLDLRDGKRIIHTAQNRTLPRAVFMRVAWQLDRKETVHIRY